LEAHPALDRIWSDPYQLRQVLMNLLTNAIHATGARGKITITIEEKGEEAILTVQDTGEGIPKENLERIFEPFFSTKSTGEGTGLGLFVARGIVDKLGGKIEVESQIGHGASFRITLPITGPFEESLKQQGGVDSNEKAKNLVLET
jgi:two-component system NtrC family sensor kinase